MKRIILLMAVLMSVVTMAQKSQDGITQFNGGLITGFSNSTPIYVAMDFGIHKDITIGANLAYASKGNTSTMIYGANANYHFNTIFKLPNEWDLYAGCNINWVRLKMYEATAVTNSGDLDFQFGCRYFFQSNFGVNIEHNIDNVSYTKLGITYRF